MTYCTNSLSTPRTASQTRCTVLRLAQATGELPVCPVENEPFNIPLVITGGPSRPCHPGWSLFSSLSSLQKPGGKACLQVEKPAGDGEGTRPLCGSQCCEKATSQGTFEADPLPPQGPYTQLKAKFSIPRNCPLRQMLQCYNVAGYRRGPHSGHLECQQDRGFAKINKGTSKVSL